VVVLVLGWLLMPGISGEEFAPDSFRRRAFRFREIPLLHIQVSGIRRDRIDHELTQWIQAQKILKVEKDPRWDLVDFRRYGGDQANGDAKILTTYLDSKNSSRDLIWLNWSKANVKRASMLWPRVSLVARQGLYLFIPDMMDAAQRSKTATELKTRLDKVLVSQYYQYSLRALERGELQVAALSLSEAIKIDPNDPELLKARGDILEKALTLAKAQAEDAKKKPAQADQEKAESQKNKN